MFPHVRMWGDSTVNRHFSYLRRILKLALKAKHMNEQPVRRFQVLSRSDDHEVFVRRRIDPTPRRDEPEGLATRRAGRRNGIAAGRTIQTALGACGPGSRIADAPATKRWEEPLRAIIRPGEDDSSKLDSLFRSAWVFPGIKHVTQSMDSRAFIRRAFERGCRQAGIVGVSWHTFRHTSASRRIMAGVDLVSVKEILGHRDIQTTLRYSHLDPRHLQAAISQGSFVLELWLEPWPRRRGNGEDRATP